MPYHSDTTLTGDDHWDLIDKVMFKIFSPFHFSSSTSSQKAQSGNTGIQDTHTLTTKQAFKDPPRSVSARGSPMRMPMLAKDTTNS